MPYYSPQLGSVNYTGGFPKGDPGFLSFFGKAIKGVGSALGAVLPGGGIISKATSLGGGALERMGASKAGKIVGRGVAIAKSHPVLTAAGGAAAIGAAGAGVGMASAPRPTMGMLPGMTGKGMHISRRTGLPVRNRHMRVANVRALHRALRRAEGFERLAKRVLKITSPHKAHKFSGFRKRRSKKR